MATERKNPNRIEQVNSLIQKEVGRILLSTLDSGNGLVTVSKVEASRDLRWAKVWVSIIGGDDDAILKQIRDNLYDIQGDLNRTLSMKMVPRLQFFLDTSPRYAEHINEILNDLDKDEDGK